MAGRFIDLDEAAQMLGISKEQVNEMREAGELYGYRDGAGWKFKSEHVEEKAKEREASGDADESRPEDLGLDLTDELSLESDSILLSEFELGDSEKSTSSTIIGKSGESALSDSDVRLVEDVTPDDSDVKEENSDLSFAGSDVMLAEPSSDVLAGDEIRVAPEPTEGETADFDLGSQFDEIEELEIDLEGEPSKIHTKDQQPNVAEPPPAEEEFHAVEGEAELSVTGISDLELLDSDVGLAEEEPAEGGTGSGLSGLELEADEDDALVLGEGSDSDITLDPGDSGISLIDPSDSGLSLEQVPPELRGSGIESLDLGAEPPISLDEAGSSAVIGEVADEDVMLKPLEESVTEEAEVEGSEVLSLDAELLEAPEDTLAAESEIGAGTALIEELGAVETGPISAAEVAGVAPASAAVAEPPYSVWNVLSLGACFFVLFLTGMMMFDLVRNMWSWNGATPYNSSLIEAVMEYLPF